MNRSVARLTIAVATGATVLVGGHLSAAAATPQPLPQTSIPSQWAELATSSTPKKVVLDSATGAVLSVTADSGISPMAITVHNPCQAGDACWVANSVPFANWGFAGTGTKNGNWTQRGPMYTHAHSTSVCWSASPNCSPRLGPNSYIGFSSYPVTGTKVRNYT